MSMFTLRCWCFIWLTLGVFLDVTCNVAGHSDSSETAEALRTSAHDAPRPPVILIPGAISSRLIAWKQKKCTASNIDILDVVWLNMKHLVETVTYDKHCWLDCLKLVDNERDPPDCKLRPDEGLHGINELSSGGVYSPSGTSVFTALVKTLANQLGYDVNNIIGAPYDWRLAPMQLESRDSYFTTLKFKIETAVKRHGRPAVVVSYSMGNNVFLYFVEWLKTHHYEDWRRWLRHNIWAYVGIAAPLLGSASPVKAVISGHAFGLPINNAQARELLLTCPSTHFINPQTVPPLSSHSLRHFEPPVTVRGVPVPRDDGSDSAGPITRNITFSMFDVESGAMFEWMGTNSPQSLLTNKHAALKKYYHNDPLRPLGRPYRRPPIKHVLMVYGVDVPTQVGFEYELRKHDAAESVPSSAESAVGHNGHTIAPSEFVLTETYYEEAPCTLALNKQRAEVVDKTAVSNLLEKTTKDTVDEDVAEAVQNTMEQTVSVTGDGEDTVVSETTAAEAAEHLHQSECQAEIYAVKTPIDPLHKIIGHNKRAVPNANRNQTHSGDVTIPYVSLSYAKTWLDDVVGEGVHHNWVGNESQGVKARVERLWNKFSKSNGLAHANTSSENTSSGISSVNAARQWSERREARIHKHFLDGLGAPASITSAMAAMDPAVEIFYAQHSSGDSTAVMEFSGVDHAAVLRHPYVHDLTLKHLLEKMAEDLNLV